MILNTVTKLFIIDVYVLTSTQITEDLEYALAQLLYIILAQYYFTINKIGALLKLKSDQISAIFSIIIASYEIILHEGLSSIDKIVSVMRCNIANN